MKTLLLVLFVLFSSTTFAHDQHDQCHNTVKKQILLAGRLELDYQKYGRLKMLCSIAEAKAIGSNYSCCESDNIPTLSELIAEDAEDEEISAMLSSIQEELLETIDKISPHLCR